MKDDEQIDPLDRFLAEEPAPLPPIAPDGGFAPQNLMPEPIPEATPETMICLRGPCRFYVEMKTRFQAGNTPGTLDHAPTVTNRFCTCVPGSDIDLTDELVSDCNQWEPQDSAVVQLRLERRKQWENSNKGE